MTVAPANDAQTAGGAEQQGRREHSPLSRPSRPVVISGTVAAVVAVMLGWPLAVAVRTGGLAIPHNDAWSHSKIAQDFARTGAVHLVGWNRTALLGQIVPLGPLGASIIVQQVFVAVLAGLGLICVFLMLRHHVGPSRAVLATAIVGAVPEFGLLATSYMSDIPAFAGTVACAYLGERALRRQSPLQLLLALAVGLWAATAREQAIAAPAAVALVALWRWRGRRMLPLLLGALTSAAFIAFELWRRSLPYGDPPTYVPSLTNGIDTTVGSCLTLGLYGLPAVLLTARPWQWRWRAWGAGVLTAAISVLYLSSGPSRPLLGNYLQRNGAYGSASIGRSWILGDDRLWTLLLAVAVLSTAAAVATLVHSRPRLSPVLGLLGVLTVVGTLAQAFAGQSVFARYLLTLLVVVLCWLLAPVRPQVATQEAGRPGMAWVPAVSGLVLLTVLAFTVTGLTESYDSARWHAASRLAARGFAPTDIDAGLEWVGYHATTPAGPPTPRPTAMTWYVRMFPQSRSCAFVSGTPRNTKPIGTYHYASMGFFGSATLYLYRSGRC